MERQYDKALRLITEVSKGLADLNDLFRSECEEQITEEEQRNLQLALIKLTLVIKEFTK